MGVSLGALGGLAEMDEPFQSLWDEFERLDVKNSRLLIEWLDKVFAVAIESSRFVPFFFPLANTLTREWPRYDEIMGEDQARVALIVDCCRRCLTARRDRPPQKLYGECAHLIKQWLEDNQTIQTS